MEPHDYTSLILYFGRQRHFHQMQSHALEALSAHPDHRAFRLYNGYALCLGGRLPEAIRELHSLQLPTAATDSADSGGITMGALLALIYAHRRCRTVDKEAVLEADARCKAERKRLGASGAYNAAIFLLLSGKLDKAAEYAERSVRLDRQSGAASVLRAWCDLLRGRSEASTLQSLEAARPVTIDGQIAQSQYHQRNGDFEAALGVLQRLAVAHPHLQVPLVEQMRAQLANWNWSHALHTSARILAADAANLEALHTRALIQLCHDGRPTEAVQTLHQLREAVARVEPSNAELSARIGAQFARLGARDADVLAATLAHCERAVQLAPGRAEFTTELGYQHLMRGATKEAARLFRAASKLDDSSMDALCGLTLCQMAEAGGGGEQARQQIEFLVELQGEGGESPLLLLMSARLRRGGGGGEGSGAEDVARLGRAAEVHFRDLQQTLFGAEYLRKFDPDFLMQLVDELLRHAPASSESTLDLQSATATLDDGLDDQRPTTGPANSAPSSAVPAALRHSLNILEAICKACPGLVAAVHRLARTQFLCGDIAAASRTLHRLLHELDASYSDAHLLQAQLQIRGQQFDRAAQTLDVCLAQDFHVRERALYHLLVGIVKRQQQQPQEALRSLQQVQELLAKPAAVVADGEPQSQLGVVDRCTASLEMVGVLVQLGRPAEADDAMRAAMQEFANGSEEGRLVLASAELALRQDRVQVAVDALKQILPGQPYFEQCKRRLAEVYLRRQNNRLAFTRCFRELVDESPGARSYVMLGNSFMMIQEPDEAIAAYREAYQLDPTDSYLAAKLGRAYVKTHQYKRAIKYYTDASRHAANSALRLDLAELYLKLRQYSNAEQTLLDTIEIASARAQQDGGGTQLEAAEALAALQTRTKQLLLLARIRERSGNLSSSLATLTEARDNQLRVQQRTSLEQAQATGKEQQKLMAKICFSMAEQANSLRQPQLAIEFCQQALQYARDDVGALQLLARLYTHGEQLEQCQRVCERILQVDANNEAASVMMADMSFRKMDFSGASYHFSQLLLAQPTYWTALTRLIEIQRRSAKLPDALPFLQQAERATGDPSATAGLHYCKGLYEWYTGNPNGALRHFNNARRDPEWGRQSIFNMIDICLNPDGDLPNERWLDEAGSAEPYNSGSATDRSARESRTLAVSTSERLLAELKPRVHLAALGEASSSSSGTGTGAAASVGLDSDEVLNHQLLAGFLTLASRQRSAIEALLTTLSELAAQEAYREHVGPIYALAAVHVVLRQAQRARNQLKRVAGRRWSFEDAEYLERCWLLLADLYIAAGKTDLALELLDKVRQHNKSCSKAYELLGVCNERTQMYNAAAENYGCAWRLGGGGAGGCKPQIGYRLAYNYMKLKRWPDAIDVCQQVLRVHPEFGVIRKEVLDKCRQNLRG